MFTDWEERSNIAIAAWLNGPVLRRPARIRVTIDRLTFEVVVAGADATVNGDFENAMRLPWGAQGVRVNSFDKIITKWG